MCQLASDYTVCSLRAEGALIFLMFLTVPPTQQVTSKYLWVDKSLNYWVNERVSGDLVGWQVERFFLNPVLPKTGFSRARSRENSTHHHLLSMYCVLP